METKVYHIELTKSEINQLMHALILQERYARETASGNLNSQFGCNDYCKAHSFIDAAEIAFSLHCRFVDLFGLK